MRETLSVSLYQVYISTYVSSTQVVIICAYMQIVVVVVRTYICCTLFLSYFIIHVTYRIKKKQMIICFYFSTCRSVHSTIYLCCCCCCIDLYLFAIILWVEDVSVHHRAVHNHMDESWVTYCAYTNRRERERERKDSMYCAYEIFPHPIAAALCISVEMVSRAH